MSNTGILPNSRDKLNELYQNAKPQPRLSNQERREFEAWLSELPKQRQRASDRTRDARMLAEILGEDLAYENDRLLGKGRTEGTQRSFKSHFKQFKAWCDEISAPALPTTPEILAAYVLRRFVEGESPTRIQQRVSAVSVLSLDIR